jgi:hypothetical protein
MYQTHDVYTHLKSFNYGKDSLMLRSCQPQAPHTSLEFTWTTKFPVKNTEEDESFSHDTFDFAI